MTTEEYRDLYSTRWDAERPPSRGWDQIELNLHHDYLDCKRVLARHQDKEDEESKRIVEQQWLKMSELSMQTHAAGLAREKGEDPLHWKLRYNAKGEGE